MIVLEKANSNSPNQPTKLLSCKLGVSSCNEWLDKSTEAEESPLSEAAAKQGLVKTQQNEKTIVCAVVTCKVCRTETCFNYL
jgi:hypothetical protein